jgi:hypothetical protein
MTGMSDAWIHAMGIVGHEAGPHRGCMSIQASRFASCAWLCLPRLEGLSTRTPRGSNARLDASRRTVSIAERSTNIVAAFVRSVG